MGGDDISGEVKIERRRLSIVDVVMYTGLILASILLCWGNPSQFILITIFCLLFFVIQVLRYHMFELDIVSPLSLWLLAVQWMIAFTIQLFVGSFLPQVFFFILIAEIGYRSSRKFSIPFFLLCYIGFVLGMGIHYNFHDIGFVIPRFLEYVLFWGFSYISGTVVSQKAKLHDAFEKVKKATWKLEEKTLTEERMRLSREIHDTVGHTLSTAIVGVETGKQLLYHKQNDRALKQFEHVHSHMKQALKENRQSVHTLYETNAFINFRGSLQTIIQEMMEKATVSVNYDLPDLPILTPQQEWTVYRALQEGLTNGIRHGHSTYFYFSLQQQENQLIFDLKDNGNFPENIEHGLGLIAMEERTKFINGSLRLTPNDEQGAHLQICFPLRTRNEQSIKKGES